MSGAPLEDVRSLVGLGPTDVANLRALGAALESQLPEVVETFYRELEAHPGAREILNQDSATAERLRRSLLTWLRGLFCGEYGAGYLRERAQIGRTHVRAGVPQHYPIAAMEIVWRELSSRVRGLAVPDAEARLASLHKLLMLEIAVMLESFRASYAAQVRQTEREAMEARLREAEQLAHIGQLAASLAHEIKNPLAGISGAIQVIRSNLRADDPHFPVLGEVLRQINRLDRSVKDLLVYSRPKPPQYRPCELPRLIERVLTLLGKEPEFERVRFEYSLARDLSPVAADEHQIEQLLMNLLLNAAQASQPGGLVRLVAHARSGGVDLLIEDRGCGMTEEVARRALEPFFTTKARGTGLGLPICQKIVDAHGGALAIRSAPGAGTAVQVTLHARPPAAAGALDEYPGPDR